jgi:hypothetical protein
MYSSKQLMRNGVFRSIAGARSGKIPGIPFERLDVTNDIGCRTASMLSLFFASKPL